MRLLLGSCVIVLGLLACDDEASSSSDTGGSGSSVGAGGVGAGNPSGPGQGGSASTQTSAGGTGGGSTGQPCDPACTGASLCNATGDCVCAPGWTFDGTACVAEAVSPPSERTKEEVCARLAVDSVPPAVPWEPGAGGCDPGTVPYDAQIATLRYLNFYRWMIGVGPVQVDPSVAAAEQQCALMLNYYFGHDPAPDVMCYTPEGAAACGASLIAGGYGLVGQVDGYALETGQNLVHRRNVLSVGRAGVWFGANQGSSDMHYGGAYPALPTDPAYVSHPGPGPQVMSKVPLNFWFVQAGTASTPPLAARVTEKSSGTDMPMTQQHYYTDFSSFQPNGWTPAAGTTYVVELVDEAQAVFSSYETTFVTCP